LNDKIEEVAAEANAPGKPDVFFVDTQARFTGHNLCTDPSGVNGLHFGVTPGEDPLSRHFNFLVKGQVVSQVSFHPNDYGTSLYSLALEDALAEHM
jgi:hypothetical protein